MQMTVDVPTKIYLSDKQQHEIAKTFLLKKVFNYQFDSLPYYHKDLMCFVAPIEGHCGINWYKVADGDDREFATLLKVLNSLITLNGNNAPLIKADAEDISLSIGNVNGKLESIA